MKPLIAIVTCHRYKDRADAQRATWIKVLDKKMDYKFFLGEGGGREPAADEVFLTVPDDYKSLPMKVRAVMQWALEHNYDAVLKVDDDVYIMPERLTTPRTQWEGRVNMSDKQLCPRGWCSGFAYWLSGSALKMVASGELSEHPSEDVWIGRLLNKMGMKPEMQEGFIVLSFVNSKLWSHYRERVVASCEFAGGKMYEIHYALRSNTPIEIKVPRNTRGFKVMRYGDALRRRVR